MTWADGSRVEVAPLGLLLLSALNCRLRRPGDDEGDGFDDEGEASMCEEELDADALLCHEALLSL